MIPNNKKLLIAEHRTLPYIRPYPQHISRSILRKLTGLSDREMREDIEILRTKHPIINMSDGKGYTLTYEPERLRAWVKQEEERIKSLVIRLKPAREIIKRQRERELKKVGRIRNETTNG